MALLAEVKPEDYRRKIAYALMQQGSDGAPVQHWAQGLARLGQGALGGYEMYQADQKDKETEAGNTAALVAALGQQPSASTVPVSAPAAPAPQPAMTPKPPAMSAAPMGNKVVDALAPPVTGPRPGGDVMPTAKVWGDKEAEDAGLYEKPAGNTQVASTAPVAIPQTSPVAQALAPTAQAAPVATDTQMADAKSRITALLNSDNPQARKLGRGLAENYISTQMSGDKPTDEIKEYNLAVTQAKAAGDKPPSFIEYKTGLKKAGATNVSVDTKGENAFATKAGQLQAARYDDLATDATSAKQMLSDVQTLDQLGKNIQTGKIAEAKAAIGPYAQALGIDVKGLSEIQAFEAIVNRVAPSLRVKGSGAQSDYELKNFLKSLPALGNTPEGNEIASKTMQGIYENKVKAAEIGSQALNRDITPAEADKRLRELPDHMADYREYLKKNTESAKSGSGSDRNAVEQEMRRRGLLK